MRRLPPLNSLRAFDAAARNLSFSAASQELHITPGAVSHQIKQLEASLGQALFIREPAGVALTPLGVLYAQEVRHALAQLEAATLRAQAPANTEKVVIRCQFSVATEWLTPKLALYAPTSPNSQILLRAEPFRGDPLGSNADLAIYYCNGHADGREDVPLLRGRYVVAVAPALHSRLGPIREPASMLTRPLIALVGGQKGWREPDWADWFVAGGQGAKKVEPLLAFSAHHMLVEALKLGAGYGLVNSTLAARALAAGELIQAHPLGLPAPNSFFLSARSGPRSRLVNEVRDWLIVQARLHESDF